MDIQGEKILQADRASVWRALNDPQVLQRCLAGCDTYRQLGQRRCRAWLELPLQRFPQLGEEVWGLLLPSL